MLLVFGSLAHGVEPFEAFLTKHCISCHGPKKKKGDLRLDQLSRDFKSGVDGHLWAEGVENINARKFLQRTDRTSMNYWKKFF